MTSIDIRISTKHPGGNIKVNGIESNVVKVEQDLRDTTRWWFYWNFHVISGYEGEVIFEFTNGEVIGPWGPAMSADNENWQWLGEENVISRESFKYCFGPNNKEMYFAFAIPYQLKDFEAFYDKYKRVFGREILTISEKGRQVPLVKLGNKDASQHIIFTCRHHACESNAGYLLEGVLSYLIEHLDSSHILNNYLIYVIPFVDIDGVEDGDQGKGREPHDHNRDYLAKPIYKSTAAIMKYVEDLDVIFMIDFHCPYKWGGRNNFPFFVKKPSPYKEEIEKLAQIFQEQTVQNAQENKITYSSIHDIDFGEGWNEAENASAGNYFCKNKDVLFACTLEFPYFGNDSIVYTQEKARLFGNDFALALEKYVKQK